MPPFTAHDDRGLYGTAETATAEEFLEALSPQEEHWGPAPQRSWVFRGQADAALPLRPTALREGALLEFTPDSAVIHGPDRSRQARAEFALLSHFYELFDQQGLAAPSGFRGLLSSQNWNGIRHKLRGPDPDWPPEELLPAIGLAQHYHLPTRLLDWSLYPLVAAYFAASEKAEGLARPGAVRDGHVAVWALNRHYVHAAWESELIHRARVYIVYPPQSENPNLHAQGGVFTVDMQPHVSPMDDPLYESLEEVIMTVHRPIGLDLVRELGGDAPVLRRITLPATQAPRLLRLLAGHNMHAGAVFPGFDGAARALLERRYWDHLPPAVTVL